MRRRGLLAASCALGLAGAARAEDCTLTRRALVGLAFDELVTVQARINGAPATMLLDTGAERSVLTAAGAKRLAVTTHYDFTRPIHGIGRSLGTGDARLASFVLGGYELPYPRVLVGDIALPALGGRVPDGLLGADLLGDFDLDLDLPRRQLTLYDRVTCAGLRPPWPGGYATIETTRSLDRHPFFPVLIDGHPLDATFNSGAQRTVLGQAAVARIGVTAAMLAADPKAGTSGAGGEVVAAHVHRFRAMVIGGETARTPTLLVAAVNLPRAADLVIGLDYLRVRRIWLSYGSRRIFVAHPA